MCQTEGFRSPKAIKINLSERYKTLNRPSKADVTLPESVFNQFICIIKFSEPKIGFK